MSAAMMQIAGVTANAAGAGTWPPTIPSLAATPSGGTAAPAPFADLLRSAAGEENRLEEQAQKAVTGLMAGTGVDVHQAMIATQKASMAFELSLAVRNKAVQAYQQVMSLQF
ncbi:MAG TPA: flagellar hook-basal body complex protein FliE [Terracidiphilus sp.]|jgi:flagellar hook-basal body complex protein FliE